MTRDDLIDRIEEAIDNVHDMGVTSRDYAVSVADALGPLLDAADELEEALYRATAVLSGDNPDADGAMYSAGVALTTYRAAKEDLQ